MRFPQITQLFVSHYGEKTRPIRLGMVDYWREVRAGPRSLMKKYLKSSLSVAGATHPSSVSLIEIVCVDKNPIISFL